MARYSIIIICVLPVFAGLLGVFLPGFGWFPIYGKSHFTFEILVQTFNQPGFLHSVWLSVSTALLSTFLAYWLCIFTLIYSQKLKLHSTLKKIIAPLIAVPHITVAMGILFLIQPSGWVFRIFSPWLTGWQTPPDLNIAPDLYGVALIIGLTAKELPFLLLVGFTVLKQVNISRYRQQITSFGYGPISGWFHIIHPMIAARMRVCVLIVLCFSVSVVDMALILAPSTPAPLAVKIFNWYQSPDINSQLIAASAAVYLLLIVLCCCVFWIACGAGLKTVFRFLSYRGARLTVRGLPHKLIILPVLALIMFVLIMGIMGLLSAGIWGFVEVWRFPDILPEKWGLVSWRNGFAAYIPPFINTLIVGFITSILALISAIIWLEYPAKSLSKVTEALVYIPLLLPQTGFLFGMQVLIIWLEVDGLYITVIWAHYLFVFPYTLLTLGPIWRRFDVRYELLGASFGFSKFKRLWRIKMPLMAVPVITSFAIGFAVSSALYLPTIFAGNGTFLTLTTEAVTLAANASRQAAGIAALLQMILPLVIFIIAGIYIRFRLHNFSYFRISH